MNAKHGKCLLTNLLPKFAIQMVLCDNRYNLTVLHILWHVFVEARIGGDERVHESNAKIGVANVWHFSQTKKVEKKIDVMFQMRRLCINQTLTSCKV